ncbi:hypothetical protein GGX14DRAFT_599781, partial [Mycena pura]
VDSGPIPLSFPAILRNPGLPSSYAYLTHSAEKPKPVVSKKHKTWRRDDNGGKRWIRRKENATFSGNTHIVQPAKTDLLPPQGPNIRSTFPVPLPPYLPRENRLPNAVLPTRDTNADCGRYSLSLKGMRRNLRTMQFRSKPLVRVIEAEIVRWLEAGGTLLFPDTSTCSVLNSAGTPIGDTGIVELSRTPLQLVWRVADDPFARYVIHCTARYHKIVSYSKDVSGQRLTYLLRPNVAYVRISYPEFHVTMGIDTPPTTDMDFSSQLDSESERASDYDVHSEAGEFVPGVQHMTTIEEDFVASPRTPYSIDDDEWSVITDGDADDDESGNDLDQSVDSLGDDPDETLLAVRRFSHLSLRSRALARAQVRSSSLPSRSPVRPARPIAALSSPKNPPKSFYNYLF